MSRNVLAIVGILMVILISIVNILSFTWDNENIHNIVHGKDEKDIDENVYTVEIALRGLTVIGVFMLIASLTMLYFIMVRDGVSEHVLTKNEYGNYTGIIIVLSIFAVIASTTVNDTINPDKDGDTDDDIISITDFSKVLSIVGGVSVICNLLIVLLMTPNLPVLSQQTMIIDEKFDFNF